MVAIGVYHGDEEWVLKGIGQDLAQALRIVDNSCHVQTTDKVFKKIVLPTDYHIYVQQGQLNQNVGNNPELVRPGTICLFTHLDVRNFKPDILHRCYRVIFNSSIQLSQAIANGYNPHNAILQPHAVDPALHRIIDSEERKMQYVVNQFSSKSLNHSYRNCVGFCGRYWDKSTYTRRKNYNLIKSVISGLTLNNIPVLVMGPGWKDFLDLSSDNLAIVETKYKNYPLYYNLMKVFVSLSIHEGGPLPLLEAMSCGVFPIVTNTGFSFDVVSSPDFGSVISPFQRPEVVIEFISNIYYSREFDRETLRNQASQFSFNRLASTILRSLEG